MAIPFGLHASDPSSTKVVYMTDSQSFHNTRTSGFFLLNPFRLLIKEIYSEMCPCGVYSWQQEFVRYCRKDVPFKEIRTVLLFHGMKPRMLQRATHTSNSRVQQLVHTLLTVCDPFPFYNPAACQQTAGHWHSEQNFTIYQVRPHYNGVLKKGNKLKLNS